MNPHFIAACLKIGTTGYLEVSRTSPVERMEQNFGLDNVVLIGDSAPSHTTKATLAFLGEKVSFFARADIWPSNIPHLNLLEYLKTNASPQSSIKSWKTCIVRVKQEKMSVSCDSFKIVSFSCEGSKCPR